MTKRKRIFVILALAVLSALCVTLLAACNPNTDSVDKAAQNREFVSFRKKIVTILKDNGIFVNDLDNPTVNATAGVGKTYASADLLYSDGESDKISQIGEIMSRSEYLADDSENGYDFALKQVYAISLEMSLCIGDGMLNYFNEKEFYNIPVYFPDMNIVITENGNRVCFYGYQKTSDNVEHVQKIEVVFNGDNDYYFTVTEPTGDWMATSDYENSMYFYGDSGKRFLMFRSGYEAVYTPNGADFYETADAKALSDCLGILGSEVFDYDVKEYRKIKDNVKHSFTEEQSTALMDKYFKDVQSSIQNRPSEFTYQEINGKNVLIDFYAGEGETEVVIPSDVKYISEQFYVEDIKGAVTALNIPASVTEIIDSDGKPQTDAQYIRFNLRRQEGETLFQNITVAQGSPLFKPGSGHLTLKDGTVVYALDKACENFDLNVLIRASLQNHDGYDYKNVYKVLSDTVNVGNTEINRLMQVYDLSYESVTELVQKVFDSSQITRFNFDVTVSDIVEPDKDPNAGSFSMMSLGIDLKSDVTVNVVFGEMQPNDEAYLGIALTNRSNTVHNVEVNVKGFTYRTVLDVGPLQPVADKGEEFAYQSNSLIQTTFNLDVMQMYYDSLCYGKLIRDEQNSRVNFDASQNEEYRYFSIYDANTNASHSFLYCSVSVTNDVRDGDEIIIPDKLFGLSVFIIRVDVSAVAGKKVTLTLPDLENGFDRVEFYNSVDENSVKLNNAEFVIVSGYDYETLNSRISDYDSSTDHSISFTLQANDKKELHQTGWEFGYGNPDNLIRRFYLYEDNMYTEMKTVEYSIRNGAVLSENADLNRAYFAYPQDGDNDNPDGEHTPLTLFTDEQGRLCADTSNIEENGVYILVTRSVGRQTMPVSWPHDAFRFDVEVTLTAEKRDGKTYFNAFVEKFSPSAGEEYDTVTYDFETVNNAVFYDWFDLSYTMTFREYDPDNPEIVTEVYTQKCGKKIILVLRNDDVRAKEKEEFVIIDVTAHVNGSTYKHAVKKGEEYQCRFVADEWNLTDIDKYQYFAAVQYIDRSEEWYPIAIEEIDGHVYAITNGSPAREFTLKSVALGQREYKMQGDNYDLTLSLNVVRPSWINGDFSTGQIEFSESAISIVGTVEGRSVIGESRLPYKPELYYQDVEYGVCRYNLTWTSDEVQFELLDEYVTISVTVNGDTFDKRVIPGEQAIFDSEWFDIDENYAYFWLVDGKYLDSLVYDTQGRVCYYLPSNGEGNESLSSLTLARIKLGENSFHIQDDDGQGNSYNLNISLTVNLNNDYENPYYQVTVAASGKYNEGEIYGASDSSSLSSVSFVWDSGMETTPRRWLIELNGLDVEIIGLGEKLF